MPKPFDATTKYLVELRPGDRAEYATGVPGLSRAGVEMIEADVSAVSAADDKVLHVHGPAPWLVHLEFQAGYDRALGDRLLGYNVSLHNRYALPVQSTVILLRPAADGPEMTGHVRHRLPDGPAYLEFDYQVLRVWQRPVESFLAGGLGTLPLAPLSDEARGDLPEVIRRMDQRLRSEMSPDEAKVYWTSSFILMGLRYPEDLTSSLLEGVRAMEESVTYQAIVGKGMAQGRAQGMAQGMAQGQAQEARKLLLLLGELRFGPPGAEVRGKIEAVTSVQDLEQMNKRMMTAADWEEVLAGAV